MKIYYHPETFKGEGEWIVDRIGREFKKYSSHNVKLSLDDVDVWDFNLIWLGASFSWKMLTPNEELLEKIYSVTPVLCTIHHIVPWKWDKDKYNEFMDRDRFVDMYHVYNEETEAFVKSMSKKPITVMPHWVNSETWFPLEKEECRDFLNIDNSNFVIGSFQRDTEGYDLATPKLEKGPDIFVEICRKLNMDKWNVEVLLGGSRRQYVIQALEKLGIKYKYFENTELETVNKMYSACDLYVVSSRCEGGPQSLFESSITKTKIISTDVGQAKKILDEKCIYAVDYETGKALYKIPGNESVESNYENILKYDIKNHIKNYDDLMIKTVGEKLK